jgi:Ca2+-binding RTX toxin-like protein
MPLSVPEQYLLELINQARLDPLAKADMLGIDLNDGLAPGTLDGSAKQVLAHNVLLSQAAEGHSNWLLTNNTFSHAGQAGSSAGDRMEDAGYVFSGAWTWGENLAWFGTTGAVDLQSAITVHDDGLFLSAGHRVNLLADAYREIGIAQVEGEFTHTDGITYNASMLTEKFARSGAEVFLTGVAYDDGDGNAFYTMGEGVAGLTFAVGAQSALSAAAGGYQLALAPTSEAEVRVTGAGVDAVLTIALGDGNAKLDIVDGTWALASADMTLVSGLTDARLLGVADLDLSGNSAGNRLIGNKGDNRILAGDGDDVLTGGAGADILTGGGGRDTASYAEAAGGVFVRLWSGEGVSGEALGDVLTGIENLRGSGFADTLSGDGDANALYGGGGADALWAGDGDDVLSGGTGADALNGQGGRDTASYVEAEGGVFVRLWSGEGLSGEALGDVLTEIENLRGSEFSDTLVGDNGVNEISGGAGADALWAGDGDDVLMGGAGADQLQGQGGRDTASYAEAGGGVFVRLWSGEGLSGEALGDVLTEIENLRGSGFADTLVGDNGVNEIFGGAGADALWAGDGDDVLMGGTGNDVLYGQAGADTFVFADNGGSDTIADWQDGIDRLDFDVTGVAGPGDMTIDVAGGNTVIQAGDVSAVLLNWQDGIDGSIDVFDFV